MRRITRKQREALAALYRRHCNHDFTPTPLPTYREFRKHAHFEVAGDAILINCNGIWIGIESNGYTHT